MTDWSSPDDVATKVRRRWASGELLSAYARSEAFTPIEVPLRGPRAGEIGADLARVQAWAQRLQRAAEGRFDLVLKPVGGRVIGRNELPARAVVTSYAQAWRLLGVAPAVASYKAILAVVEHDQVARELVASKPHAALAVGDEWPGVLAARTWLETQRGSGRFLREISAPGVDTKFVERHRATLAALLDVPAGSTTFLTELGLLDRPARVRLRFEEGFAGLPPGVTEAAFRLDELSVLPVEVSRAVVVENEITFLSVPVPASGVVVWGEGFRVNRAGALPWLVGMPVHYWGDLDTHGFAILDRLRAWLPQTESFLMDSATLLAHRDRWGSEPSPTSAALSRLTGAEASVYRDLVTDRHAERLRLEQERVDWAWVLEAWPAS